MPEVIGPATVYRICPVDSWQVARRDGIYRGEAVDRRDGYLHLSGHEQIAATLETHFAGRDGLVLLVIETADLGNDLIWEPSRNGADFPHLYAPLPLEAVRAAYPLRLDAGGRHILPNLPESPGD